MADFQGVWPNRTETSVGEALLTAFNRIGGHLEGHDLAAGLRNVDPEHQSHAGVLPSNVCLAVPQFDVCVSQLQDSYTVDAGTEETHGELLCEPPSLLELALQIVEYVMYRKAAFLSTSVNI